MQLPLASNPTLPSPPEQPCAWQRSHAPPCDWGLERAWVQTLVGDLSKTLDGGRASWWILLEFSVASTAIDPSGKSAAIVSEEAPALLVPFVSLGWNACSSAWPLSCGIPPGSVLAHTLFDIYVNLLAAGLSKCRCHPALDKKGQSMVTYALITSRLNDCNALYIELARKMTQKQNYSAVILESQSWKEGRTHKGI